ncbi:hypothetical protein TNCV_2310841 [Trichonephila clavipes]|nr:hypothetical protein TNCV_2310841 [Trichonephila clavipes]
MVEVVLSLVQESLVQLNDDPSSSDFPPSQQLLRIQLSVVSKNTSLYRSGTTFESAKPFLNLRVVVVANFTCLTVSDRGLKHSSRKRPSGTPVVSRSFGYHTDDGTIWLGSIPILKGNALEVVRGFPPLFTFHQPHKRTCDSTAI